MGAGSKGAGGSGAHDYYGTIAGAVCAGPVDALLGIICDGKTVWPEASGEWESGVEYLLGAVIHSGGRAWVCTLAHTSGTVTAPGNLGAPWEEVALRRTDPGVGNPVKVTVPGYGFAILHWGTDDQDHGPDTPAAIAADHPPYRRQCWVILQDWLFGRERTSAPNVEILVRRAPAQTIVTGDAAALDNDGQANPVAFAAEILQDPVFGAGAGELAEPESWQAAADTLEADPALWYLSPIVDDSKPFRAVAEALGSYAPVFQRATGDGRIGLGTLPTEGPEPFVGPDVTVDEFVLAESVSWEIEGAAVAEVSVRYDDRARAYKARSQKATDTLSRDGTDPEPVSLDRPWITRAGQAAFAAADQLRRMAGPGGSGRAVVLRDRCPWLVPGNLFMLSDAAVGLRVLCRVLRATDAPPPSGLRTVTFEAETGFAPQLAQASADGANPANPPAPEVLDRFRLVQPPPALVGGDSFRLAALVARSSPVTIAARLWLQEADPALFVDLGAQGGFALAGELAAGYSSGVAGAANPPDDDSEALRITMDAETPPADLELLSETQSADAIGDARVVVWLFKASGEFEVLTLRSARVATGETFWRLKVRRARFGTSRLTFSAGDRAFVVRRSSIVAFEHRLFGAYALTGTAATFRLQARNPWRVAELSAPAVCPDIPFDFADPYAPGATWTLIQYRPPGGAWGNVTDFAAVRDPAGTWRLGATLTDPNADLMGAILRSIGPESTDATLFSGANAGGSDDLEVEFTLPEGDWIVVLKVLDRSGRSQEVQLAPVAGGAGVVLRMAPAGSVVVANPIAAPRGGDFFADPTVALTSSTAGATVEFQVVTLGAALGGSWTTYSAPVSVPVGSTLYTRAIKAGMTDSPTVRHDYRYLDPETVG